MARYVFGRDRLLTNRTHLSLSVVGFSQFRLTCKRRKTGLYYGWTTLLCYYWPGGKRGGGEGEGGEKGGSFILQLSYLDYTTGPL